jgi:hypothetical protein
MTMEIDQNNMGDESGGEPESGFHQPSKSRCHLLSISLVVRVAPVVFSVKAQS